MENKNLEEMKKENEAFNVLLNLLGGEENSPIDFKIMKAHRDLFNESKKVMTNRKFIRLDDDNELKKTMLKVFDENLKLVREINEKLSESEEK